MVLCYSDSMLCKIFNHKLVLKNREAEGAEPKEGWKTPVIWFKECKRCGYTEDVYDDNMIVYYMEPKKLL